MSPFRSFSFIYPTSSNPTPHTPHTASNKIWNREWKRQWILAANRVYKLASKELFVDETDADVTSNEEQKEAEKAEKAAIGDEEKVRN